MDALRCTAGARCIDLAGIRTNPSCAEEPNGDPTRAMVHHGGVGTTSEGLRAGIPTLIVPFAFDQPDNAAHAARAGGSRTLPRTKYKTSRVANELNLLLSDPDYKNRAEEIGKLVRQENGAAAACDLIEQVLREQRVLVSQLEEPAYASGD